MRTIVEKKRIIVNNWQKKAKGLKTNLWKNDLVKKRWIYRFAKNKLAN